MCNLEEPEVNLQTVAVSAVQEVAAQEVLDSDAREDWSALKPAITPRTVTEELPVEALTDEMTELIIGLVYENANVTAEARPKRVTEELSCMPTPDGAVHNMWLSDDHSEAKQSVAPMLELKLLLLKVPKL